MAGCCPVWLLSCTATLVLTTVMLLWPLARVVGRHTVRFSQGCPGVRPQVFGKQASLHRCCQLPSWLCPCPASSAGVGRERGRPLLAAWFLSCAFLCVSSWLASVRPFLLVSLSWEPVCLSLCVSDARLFLNPCEIFPQARFALFLLSFEGQRCLALQPPRGRRDRVVGALVFCWREALTLVRTTFPFGFLGVSVFVLLDHLYSLSGNGVFVQRGAVLYFKLGGFCQIALEGGCFVS